MPRYFLEVSYKGTDYSGFQAQENANSIQAEIEKAFSTYFREPIEMTGSSRTDTGVHALQNFFHFDSPLNIPEQALYNINSILPRDIAALTLRPVLPDAHCRFDAHSREYRYYVYKDKDPFLNDRAFYYPYPLDIDKLQAAAEIIIVFADFSAFSKRNTQVKNFICTIYKSNWARENNCWVYGVQANRFLRGMVRGLVGTMLQVGRSKISLGQFESILKNKDASQTDFSVPGHGLFLARVYYAEDLFIPS
jgi:tRNA pseudouridine38-40 synthase